MSIYRRRALLTLQIFAILVACVTIVTSRTTDSSTTIDIVNTPYTPVPRIVSAATAKPIQQPPISEAGYQLMGHPQVYPSVAEPAALLSRRLQAIPVTIEETLNNAEPYRLHDTSQDPVSVNLTYNPTSETTNPNTTPIRVNETEEKEPDTQAHALPKLAPMPVLAASTPAPTAVSSEPPLASPVVQTTAPTDGLGFQLSLKFLAWLTLGTFLGAVAVTIIPNPKVDAVSFYRRLVVSLIGGVGLTPMILMLGELLIRLQPPSSQQTLMLYTLSHSGVVLGVSFMISTCFWGITTWYQIKNDQLLDKLTGLDESSPSSNGSTINNNRTIIIVADSVEEATNVIKTIEQMEDANGRS